MMPDFDQGEFVRALLDPELPPPKDLQPVHGLPPLRRFAVHRNNLAVGLSDALCARFPVCMRLVGEEFFRGLALHYVRFSRPRTPMLFEYGEDFPQFVATFEPARDLPYLPDVAHLEYAMGRAYHSPDAAPLPLEFVCSLPGDRLADATASLHPSTQVVSSDYPVVSIWRANMALGAPPPALKLDRSEDALVVRPRLDVKAYALPAGGWAFVKALMDKATFGEATNAASRRTKDFDLAATLCKLLASEAFVSVDIGDTRS